MHTSQEIAPSTEPIDNLNNAHQPGVSGATANDPPWGLPLAVLTWFLSLALLVIVPPIAALPYLLYHYQEIGAISRETLLADKTFIFFNILAVIPVHLITLGLVWAVATRFGRLPFRQVIGWSWSSRFGFWTSAGLAIVLLGIAMVILFRFGGGPTDMDRIIFSSRLNACTTAFLAAVTAPLVEELVYRGILYSALQRALGMTGAVLVVTSLFTVIHGPEYWPNFGVLSTILLLSLSLTLVRARTGRILPCYIMHLVFNGVQSMVIVIGVFLPDKDKMLQQHANGATILARLFGFHF